MTATRRILTPIAAAVLAGVIATVAAVGCAVGGGAEATKGDLGGAAAAAGRYVTVASEDAAAGVTTLIRLRGTDAAY